MDHIPTGHRRRILSSLETLMVEVDGSSMKVPVRRKPIPRPRQVFPKDKQRGTSSQHPQGSKIQMTSQTVPARTIADSERVSSSSSSTSEHGSSESLENFSEEPIPDENDDYPSELSSVGFQGEMVENEIYEKCSFVNKPSRPRSSRSYKLRHRPVPEIPEHPFKPLYDW